MVDTFEQRPREEPFGSSRGPNSTGSCWQIMCTSRKSKKENAEATGTYDGIQ